MLHFKDSSEIMHAVMSLWTERSKSHIFGKKCPLSLNETFSPNLGPKPCHHKKFGKKEISQANSASQVQQTVMSFSDKIHGTLCDIFIRIFVQSRHYSLSGPSQTRF